MTFEEFALSNGLAIKKSVLVELSHGDSNEFDRLRTFCIMFQIVIIDD